MPHTDTLYYNIHMHGDQQRVPAFFKENRVLPILDKAGEWRLSVVRFEVSAHNIPIWISPPFARSYAVVYAYQGVRTTADVNFGTDNSYYNYHDIIDRINHTYQSTFQTFTTEVSNSIGNLPPDWPTEAPRLILRDDLRFEIIFLPAYEKLGVQFGHNYFLENKLRAIQHTRVGNDYMVVTTDNVWNHVDYNGTTYHYNRGLTSTLSKFHSAVLLLFETSMPVRAEKQTGQADILSKVITDFALNAEVWDGTSILYTPSGPLRYYNITSSSPLTEVSLDIFCMDEYDRKHPLLLTGDDECRVKIMFERTEK
jgi:hypothetical protein